MINHFEVIYAGRLFFKKRSVVVERLQSKGRNLIIAFITLQVAFSILDIMVLRLHLGSWLSLMDFANLVGVAIVSVLLFRGKEWLQTLLGVVLLITAVMGFIGLALSLPNLSFLDAYRGIIFLNSGVWGIVFLKSRSIKSFLQYQSLTNRRY